MILHISPINTTTPAWEKQSTKSATQFLQQQPALSCTIKLFTRLAVSVHSSRSFVSRSSQTHRSLTRASFQSARISKRNCSINHYRCDLWGGTKRDQWISWRKGWRGIAITEGRENYHNPWLRVSSIGYWTTRLACEPSESLSNVYVSWNNSFF